MKFEDALIEMRNGKWFKIDGCKGFITVIKNVYGVEYLFIDKGYKVVSDMDLMSIPNAQFNIGHHDFIIIENEVSQ